MTFYMSIMVLQEPYDLGLDEKGRLRMVFNILASKYDSDTFLEEILVLLEDAAVGTFNTDMFISSKAAIPASDGPYLTITETSGLEPMRTHNSNTPEYQRPGAQIVVRGTNVTATRAMARAAYKALRAIINTNVVP